MAILVPSKSIVVGNNARAFLSHRGYTTTCITSQSTCWHRRACLGKQNNRIVLDPSPLQRKNYLKLKPLSSMAAHEIHDMAGVSTSISQRSLSLHSRLPQNLTIRSFEGDVLNTRKSTWAITRNLMLASINATTRENFQRNQIENKMQQRIFIRSFQNVGHYHNVADETLHSIQDAVEMLVEDNLDENEENVPELNYADGVLTMNFPPHGTWVINKQTPNQQLWWSSPLSGPRRYEYVEEYAGGEGRWVYSRVIEDGGEINENDTLGSIVKSELKQLYGWDLELDA